MKKKEKNKKNTITTINNSYNCNTYNKIHTKKRRKTTRIT